MSSFEAPVIASEQLNGKPSFEVRVQNFSGPMKSRFRVAIHVALSAVALNANLHLEIHIYIHTHSKYLQVWIDKRDHNNCIQYVYV